LRLSLRLENQRAVVLGHISEIVDGDPPHTPRGCPFQAWSVGEALRLDRIVLARRADRPERLTEWCAAANSPFVPCMDGARVARGI
jgi:glycogen debranching enzyme